MFTHMVAPSYPDMRFGADWGSNGNPTGNDIIFTDKSIGAPEPSRIVVLACSFLNDTGLTNATVNGEAFTSVSTAAWGPYDIYYAITYMLVAEVPTGTTADFSLGFADVANSYSMVAYYHYNASTLLPYDELSPNDETLGTLTHPLDVQKGGLTLLNSYVNADSGIYTDYTNATQVTEYHPTVNRSMTTGYHFVTEDDSSRDYIYTPVGTGLDIGAASTCTWRKGPRV
jgi:hypothetical protein